VIKDDFAALRRPGDAPRGPTALEAANLPALSPDKPGAGYIDPCPAGAPVRTYHPTAIDTPITYNRAGWKDREGRVYVEGQAGVDAVRAGKNPEPYTIRASVGDCVQIQTTNDTHLDDDPSVPIDHLNKRDGDYMHEEETSEISTHVHLVKFDELGSDGTSVGWNYVQAAMPGQTYGYRWFIDQPLRTVFFHDHQYANLHQQKGLFAALNVEPKDATWSNDVGPVADVSSPSGPDFREFTVFHQDRAPMWKNPGTGPSADDQPVNPPGEPMDYGADQGGYAFNYRNEPFQIRTRPGLPGQKGDPAYVYSSAVWGDPSTPLFQAYENDPVIVRNVAGSHEEMHTFNVHGHRWLSEPDNDASTLNDNQSIGLAEYFNYELQGSSVQRSPATKKETIAKAQNTQANGTPQILVGGAGKPGDYLYGSTALDDQWLGMWGIFRVPKTRASGLDPLPDRPGSAPTAANAKAAFPALAPGATQATPAPNADPGVMCPARTPVRVYDVTAVLADIVYNGQTGDHDPYGALFAPTESVTTNPKTGVATLKPGIEPTPLFLRANAGDCVKVTLRNGLPPGGIPDHDGPAHHMFDDQPFPEGDRVSLHPSLVKYDVTRSDGATVGYNYDQTVAPGKSIQYAWYVDPAIDGATTNLVDLGDRKGNRHHGLWGGLLVEPKGSTWTDPKTGLSLAGTPSPSGQITGTKTGEAADISWTDATGKRQSYREFVADFQDGLTLRDSQGTPIPEAGHVDDAYELGNRGINYRTERFAPRLGASPTADDHASVMSSVVHGDPHTPVFRAYVGDRVRLRVLEGSDRGRAHSFLMHGHEWPSQYTDPTSMPRSSQDGLLTGRAFTFDLLGGAGGRQQATGDYLYRDGLLINQTNAGLWGLLRVLPPNVPQASPDYVRPLP
jgi:hypothetical protein